MPSPAHLLALVDERRRDKRGERRLGPIGEHLLGTIAEPCGARR